MPYWMNEKHLIDRGLMGMGSKERGLPVNSLEENRTAWPSQPIQDQLGFTLLWIAASISSVVYQAVKRMPRVISSTTARVSCRIRGPEAP